MYLNTHLDLGKKPENESVSLNGLLQWLIQWLTIKNLSCESQWMKQCFWKVYLNKWINDSLIKTFIATYWCIDVTCKKSQLCLNILYKKCNFFYQLHSCFISVLLQYFFLYRNIAQLSLQPIVSSLIMHLSFPLSLSFNFLCPLPFNTQRSLLTNSICSNTLIFLILQSFTASLSLQKTQS